MTLTVENTCVGIAVLRSDMHLIVTQIHIGNHLGIGTFVGFYYLGKFNPIASSGNEVISIIVLSHHLGVVHNDGGYIAYIAGREMQISAIARHCGIFCYLGKLPFLQCEVGVFTIHSCNVGA